MAPLVLSQDFGFGFPDTINYTPNPPYLLVYEPFILFRRMPALSLFLNRFVALPTKQKN